MLNILSRAACFIAIIILGYVLRRIGFFKKEDFHVLSKIVLKITLPAAIVVSFTGKTIDPSLLVLSLIGFGGGVLLMFLGYLINLRSGREMQSFGILNTSGYNIGNFTMPFVQSFLGPVGVITTSLFDTGNAFICLGGAKSVAGLVKGKETEFPLIAILKSITKSVAFDTYIIMVTLSLLGITLPQPVTSFAEIIGNGNAFMAMLMIGVGFQLSGDRSQIGQILKILIARYGLSLILSYVLYNYTPFALEIRQTLAVLVFAPIASAAPAFTGELKGDIGLSSAVNSISIIISIVCIITVLGIVL